MKSMVRKKFAAVELIENNINSPDDGEEAELFNEGHTLTAHYLDVGQGDSIFIELPNSETMLIDAGNPGNENIISAEIKNSGYSRLDYVVATHPHNDHIGSMASIIDSFDVGKIYMPKKSHTTKSFENLVNTISEKGMNIHTAKAGVNILDSGGLKADILAPIGENYSDLNHYSAVIKIQYGQTSFLFMGDAESLVENELISSGVDLSADVLKVGHHGSNSSSSSAFIKEVSPEHAVISCGEGNSYGHPHSETLAVLVNHGVNVYRTDEAGTIIITSDGTNISVEKKASAVKENAPPAAVSSTKAPAQEEAVESVPQLNNNDDIMVYITRTGECYHRSGCSSLSKSKIETTLQSAKSSGYRACQRCNPPQ